ncbi:MAG: hypothetical protein HYV63_33730 [Candidatus Schekmanbacteria bacterium]|nr:hypothetical protein [Candidatus Schekmanbacteria bacterium]
MVDNVSNKPSSGNPLDSLFNFGSTVINKGADLAGTVISSGTELVTKGLDTVANTFTDLYTSDSVLQGAKTEGPSELSSPLMRPPSTEETQDTDNVAGIFDGLGSSIGSIPTPWTMAIGGILKGIGAIVKGIGGLFGSRRAKKKKKKMKKQAQAMKEQMRQFQSSMKKRKTTLEVCQKQARALQNEISGLESARKSALNRGTPEGDAVAKTVEEAIAKNQGLLKDLEKQAAAAKQAFDSEAEQLQKLNDQAAFLNPESAKYGVPAVHPAPIESWGPMPSFQPFPEAVAYQGTPVMPRSEPSSWENSIPQGETYVPRGESYVPQAPSYVSQAPGWGDYDVTAGAEYGGSVIGQFANGFNQAMDAQNSEVLERAKAAGVPKDQLKMMQFQMWQQKQMQMTTMFTNLIKNMHEAMMNIIRNLKV